MLRYRVLFVVIVQHLCRLYDLCRLYAGVQFVTGSEWLHRVSAIVCLGRIHLLLREKFTALTDTV